MIARQWDLQQAIFARLSAALAGQGVGGADVAVFDHIPQDPDRLHVRIDAFRVVPGGTRAGRTDQHSFSVHVFDDNTGDATGAGRAEIARLLPLVVDALEDWQPFEGATAVQLITIDSAPDAASQGGVCKFQTMIGG